MSRRSVIRHSLRSALLLRLRRVAADGDRGSLPMLMLVMIATTALGAVMMTTMLSASHTSEDSQSRVLALNAAQSGIDAVVGQIRNATSSTSALTGDSGRLPCGPFSSGAGTASADSGVAPNSNDANTTSYTATIAYYDVDPSTLGTYDLTNTTAAGGQKMLCTNAGPYNTTTAIRTPKYALITSTGTYGRGTYPSTRSLQTTYNFQVLNQNISGGQIRLYPASSSQTTQWCMDVGSSPAVGTAVTLQACSGSNPPAAQQVFEYRTDLSIELVSSVTNPNSAGLCLDTGASPTAHHSGDAIVLERCGVADSSVCPAGSTPASYHTANPTLTCSVSPWNQQWSVDDSAHLEGATTTQSNIDGYCINAASQTAGVALNLAGCAGGTTDPAQTWIPSPSTGAGMAGAGNNQLVNFLQFSMCLDVTGQNVYATFLILYTCKQNPNPSNVAWNQKFIPSPNLGTAPTSVLITAVAGGITYCLKSPQSPGGYPVLVAQGVLSTQCPLSASLAPAGSPYLWTMSQRYSNSAGTVDLPYANQYTIKDSSATPLCLSIGTPNSSVPQYSTAIVASCDGSNGQKWNANAITSAATLTNTTEINSSSGG